MPFLWGLKEKEICCFLQTFRLLRSSGTGTIKYLQEILSIRYFSGAVNFNIDDCVYSRRLSGREPDIFEEKMFQFRAAGRRNVCRKTDIYLIQSANGAACLYYIRAVSFTPKLGFPSDLLKNSNFT